MSSTILLKNNEGKVRELALDESELTEPLPDRDALDRRLAVLETQLAAWREPDLETVIGLWDDELDDYTRYHVEIQFVDKVMGGTPRNPDLIAGWMRKNLGVTNEEEIVRATRKTLLEIGVEVPEMATIEELSKAAEAVGAEKHGNTFKRDSRGLFLEGRHVKAMLKESTNICFAGDPKDNLWGRTKKRAKSAMAEWVFVDELRVHLGRERPDSTFTMHGVVGGPQGDRSTLTQYDYCFQPRTSFTLFSFEDRVKREHWLKVLKHGQFIGLGALRSQDMGRFKVQAFDRLDAEPEEPSSKRRKGASAA